MLDKTEKEMKNETSLSNYIIVSFFFGFYIFNVLQYVMQFVKSFFCFNKLKICHSFSSGIFFYNIVTNNYSFTESRYVPPHMRHAAATAPETIPEGAPVYENWSRGPQQYVRSGRGNSGTFGDRNVPMRKSQSYAGIQPVVYFVFLLFVLRAI